MAQHLVDPFLEPLQVKAKTKLLSEGQTAQSMFFIRTGCIRACYSHKGNELTAQFFFDGEVAASLESFLYDRPSIFTLEAIEDCDIALLSKTDYQHLMDTKPTFREWFYQTALIKMIGHTHRLMSFIQHSPQERYQELVAQQPHLLQRVAQHYVASYLGITPVSLSRIRRRK